MGQTASAILNYQQLEKQILAKEFSPVYLFHGSENYFIDKAMQLIDDNCLPEEEKSFNQTILYGESTKLTEVIENAKRYPMMSEYHVVIVKDAKKILQSKNDKEIALLISYLENPLNSTILIFGHQNGSLDARSKLFKALAKHSTMKSESMRDYEVRSFIDYWLNKEDKNMDSDAIALLVDYVGLDLYAIENELKKLYTAKGERIITIKDVDEIVGFNRQYSVFELQKALGAKNFNKSIQIAHHMGNNAKSAADFIPSIGSLNGYFEKVLKAKELLSSQKGSADIAKELKVSPFFIKEYISAAQSFNGRQLKNAFEQVLMADMKVKGMHRGNQTPKDIWVDMVLRILQN